MPYLSLGNGCVQGANISSFRGMILSSPFADLPGNPVTPAVQIA